MPCSSTFAAMRSGRCRTFRAQSTSRCRRSRSVSRSWCPTGAARSSRTAPSARARTGSFRRWTRRLPGCDLDGRRNRRLAGARLPRRLREPPRRGQARTLQPAPADPRGRRGWPAQASGDEHPADRRRRARIAVRALPRSSGHRPNRDRRRRRRRLLEPPTSGAPFDRRARRAQGAIGPKGIDGAQPGRGGRHLRGAIDLGERRPDPHGRLGPDRRRRRQLPDALPAERRIGLARHPRRRRLDLSFRGSGDRLQAARGPVLPLPLSRASRRRNWRRAARRVACSASYRA